MTGLQPLWPPVFQLNIEPDSGRRSPHMLPVYKSFHRCWLLVMKTPCFKGAWIAGQFTEGKVGLESRGFLYYIQDVAGTANRGR